MPKIIADPTTKIINASFDVLKKYGEERFSMRLVAKKANISVGTIYNYYPDKESLLKAIGEKQSENLIKEISSYRNKGKETKDAILELYEKTVKAVELKQGKDTILPALAKALSRIGKEGLEPDYVSLVATAIIVGIEDGREKNSVLLLAAKTLK
ncbi:MAG: TetR/AcrR family transcriptional regulator [Bacilli bacterium]|nr:TetR/AcrR family transcriptional regulator [Bacilli bacterium]